MELRLHSTPNPLPFSSFLSPKPPNLPFSITFPSLPDARRRKSHHSGKRTVLRASSLGTADGSGVFSWEKFWRSIRRGSDRFLSNFREYLKKETGFDLESANLKAGKLVNRGKEVVDRFRVEVMPEFVEWNKWENWKINGSLARRAIKDLMDRGAIRMVCAHSSQQIYTRATNT